jgi:hypothetical protein
VTTTFLLSPARCGGPRASLLARSSSEMGVALRGVGAPIGDVFTWLSALYFRGKLTYATKFGAPPNRVLVIAPGAGLVPPDAKITAPQLRAMGHVDIASAAFIDPLRRSAELVEAEVAPARVVLLGSVATGKYVDTLIAVFGARLVFPPTFVGRGDMSRGGLLLRSARSGDELDYAPIQGAVLRGKRPPRLPRLRVRAAQS